MTQKEKDLLLIKDLCSRLNTNLVCSIYRIDDNGVGYRDEILSGYCKGDIWYEFYFGDDCGIGIDNVSKIRPYLFPIESMSEEQKKKYNFWKHEIPVCHYEYGEVVEEVELYDSPESVEYLIENHFDYHGLIPMGLANDATNLNIYRL
jgi:hypothetical protein